MINAVDPLTYRAQRQRKKGWRKPANSVCVDRSTRWGNPFTPYSTVAIHPKNIGIVGCSFAATVKIQCGCAYNCLSLYRVWLYTYMQQAMRFKPAEFDFFKPLRNKILLCWCSLDSPCHADVIYQLMQEYPRP